MSLKYLCYLYCLLCSCTLALFLCSCDAPSSSSNGPFTIFDCNPDEEKCFQPKNELLEVKILNTLPILLPKTFLTVNTSASILNVDIGGYCSEGFFPNTNIVWSLTKQNDTAVISSSAASSTIQCYLGRFQVSIPLTNITDTTLTYDIHLQIYGLDDNGFTYTNDVSAKPQPLTLSFLPN